MSNTNTLLSSMFAAAKPQGSVSIGPALTKKKIVDPLETLKEDDALFSSVIYQCDHSALYKFDMSVKQWIKTEIVGHLYIYKRLDEPLNSFAVISKNGSSYIRPIGKDARVELKTPYVFVHFKGKAYMYYFFMFLEETVGICFGDSIHTANVFQALVSLVKASDLKEKRPPSLLEAMFSKENKLKEQEQKDQKPIKVIVEKKNTVKTSVKVKGKVVEVSFNICLCLGNYFTWLVFFIFQATNTQSIKFETEVKDLNAQNLRCIQSIDPSASSIVAYSCHAMLYKYDILNDKWDKTEVGGPFFLYNKDNSHNYSYMIANRQILDDLVQPINPEMRFVNNAPFIYTNIPGKDISALWFGNEDDCHSIYHSLNNVKQKIESNINIIDLATLSVDESQP